MALNFSFKIFFFHGQRRPLQLVIIIATVIAIVIAIATIIIDIMIVMAI